MSTNEELWTNPTDAMVQAGIAELNVALKEWAKEEYIDGCPIDPEDITDDMKSDLVVFILQAMAGKRNEV